MAAANNVPSQQEQPAMHLDEHDPREIKATSTVVICGGRGKGKSTLNEHLCYVRRELIPTAVVFSCTEKTNHFFSNFIPDSFIMDELDVQHIQRILDRQKRVINDPPASPDFNPHVLLLFDDVFADRKVWNQALVRWLFLNGRQDNLGVWVNTQYAMDVPKGLRANVDYWYFLQETAPRVLETLYKEFFQGLFEDEYVFQAMFKHYTADRGVLVLKSSGTTIAERLFWYRAERHAPGSWHLDHWPDMWLKHRDCYIDPRSKPGTTTDWRRVNAGGRNAGVAPDAPAAPTTARTTKKAQAAQAAAAVRFSRRDRDGNLIEDV
jgi:hypothetical protein